MRLEHKIRGNHSRPRRKQSLSENFNYIGLVTLSCLIVGGGSNKMHQGKRQDFLKWWRGVVFLGHSLKTIK